MDFQDLLTRFNNVKACGERQYKACCPAHNDKVQSLSIGQAEDGKVLINCFAGCELSDILQSAGLEIKDLFPDTEKPYNSGKTVYTNRPALSSSQFNHEKKYTYTDEKGNFIAYKIKRWDEKGNKTFIWKHYDDRGQLVDGNGLNKGQIMPLYNISELIRRKSEIQGGTPVYIAEGEKDADTLKSLGLLAVSCPNGASSRWQKKYTDYFKGVKTVILTDNDDAGRKSGRKIAAAINPIADSVKLIPSENIYTELKDKGDITDIFEMFGEEETKSLLFAAVDKAEPYTEVKSLTPEDNQASPLEVKRPWYITTKFLATGEVEEKVSPTLLAQHIREHCFYLFMRAGEKALTFWYNDTKGIYEQCSDNEFKGHIKAFVEVYKITLVNTRLLNEVYNLLATDTAAAHLTTPHCLDADENIINFKNGLLYLDTLELKPHTPEVFSTVQISAEWKPGAKCGVFNDYLQSLVNYDPAAYLLIWEYIGLTLSNIPGYRTKRALFLCGVPNSGKSKLWELLAALVGVENTAALELKDLEEGRFGSSSLWRKRLAGSGDMSFIAAEELNIFKKLTGGDAIGFEFKGKDRFSDTYKGTMLFCSNELPRFGGDKGEHVYERMIVVNCPNSIPYENQDNKLIEKLKAEADGIAYNAVLNLQRLVENGYKLTLPESSLKLRERHKLENDNVLQFLDECTEQRQKAPQDGDITTGQIYKVYKCWAENNGYKPVSSHSFKKSVRDKYGYINADQAEYKANSGKRYYKNFVLYSSAITEFASSLNK